jgi:hypothetical protein
MILNDQLQSCPAFRLVDGASWKISGGPAVFLASEAASYTHGHIMLTEGRCLFSIFVLNAKKTVDGKR